MNFIHLSNHRYKKFLGFSDSINCFQNNMTKLLLATILIGLLAGTLVKSGEALIRAGRDHVPFRTVDRDAEVVREMLNNGDYLSNFKQGISNFSWFEGKIKCYWPSMFIKLQW